eukprot:TRINITY_DN46393_c0_g1_i1.p1 TRINITY_DN46393_c0_g1~~TRINITY_DN46393_c0_g1_i1.p1  ORF type:complete len:146 (-),score=13.16 TRINITY_DN46393_c0_g1_i1:87-467(-)
MVRFALRGLVTVFAVTTSGVTALRVNKHRPAKPTDLASYKDAAAECLTWCSGLDKDTCFRSCLDDCAGYLGPPPCIGFALDVPCYDACNGLEPAFACLRSVVAGSTHECHVKLNNATLPAKECKLP